MYADRHARSSALDPRSLGIAIALNGGALAALLLTHSTFKVVDHTRPLQTYPVAIDKPPPPVRLEQPQHHRLQRDMLVTVPRPVDLPPTNPPIQTIDLPPLGPVDTGPAVGPIATPTPALIVIAPEVDPAHRADLQPAYPAGELRAEREGRVEVRVLVGTDGRVRQVEQVSATSAAFFESTRERALAKWRFRPATRGGVPVEAWRTMAIRFVIPRG